MLSNPDSYHSFQTRTERIVRIRPLHAADVEYLVDIFEHLGPESRYLRFHEPLADPDPEWIHETAEEMTTTTVNQGWGLLAFTDLPDRSNVAIGGARYVHISPSVAEVALTVRDDMQGQGIGRELLRLLALEAQAEGVEKLVAVVQAQNRAVLHLLAHAPVPVKRELHHGEMSIEVDLTSIPQPVSAS